METLQPKLRFQDFKGNWAKKKLKEVSFINPSNKDLPNEFIYIDLESVNDGLLTKENKISLDEAPSRAQRLLKKDDIVFQTVRPYQKNNYYFNNDGDYVASTGYAQLRANESSKFLFQYLHNQKFVDNVIEKCTGSSYPAINSTDLANIIVVFPEKDEQIRIANFLYSIDEKLNLLKEKKSLLEDYKKGIMQKIFNQEIRFKDDNGIDFEDWEEKSLGEVTSITIGEFVIKTRQNPNGEYPVYNGGKSCTGYYDEFNNDGNKIVISARGANAGFVNFEKGKFWAGNSCYSVGVLDKYHFEIIYFYYYIKFNENTFIENQQAANIPSVSKKDVEKFNIKIPSLEEQTKIANFLSAIDKKLDLVSNQIQDTREYKKGLLQQMFV